MFMFGKQGELMIFPYDDLFDNAAADIERYNFGVHAEDFVMPLTSYTIEDDRKDQRSQITLKTQSLTKENGKCLSNKIKKALEDHNYTVGDHRLNDNTVPVINVTSTAASSKENQIEPEFTRTYFKSQGFSQDIDDLYTAVKYDENAAKQTDPTYYQEYKEKDGLMTDTLNKPVLPVTVMADNKDIKVENRRYFKPAQAWRLLGAKDLPVWYKNNGTRYIPWPKFGNYGKTYGRELCEIYDVEAVKALDKNT